MPSRSARKQSSTVAASIERIEPGGRNASEDKLAVEEPLEIRLNGQSVAVVMRTPGHDEELAAGFLFTEAILRDRSELKSVGHRKDKRKPDLGNVVEATTDEAFDLEKRGWQRNFVSASSCGLCGKLTIESVRLQAPSVRGDDVTLDLETIRTLPEKMRSKQTGFEDTGGVHAAGLFDSRGKLVVLREDIGRHNAVDKVVGWAFLQGRLPLEKHVLMVSGRASFEIVQKALMAHIPVIAAVSAPSNLAVDLARELGMSLVGFLRGDAMNVYAGAERIVAP